MEIKDLIEVIGIEGDIKDLTKEKVQEYFTKTYIGREGAVNDPEIKSKITGKITGIIENKIKKNVKALGLEIPDDVDFKTKWEDGLDNVFTNVIGSNLKTLQENASKNNDDKVKELALELDKYKKTISEKESILNNTKLEYENQLTQAKGSLKKLRIDNILSNEEKGISWSETADELKMKGFKSILNEKYKVDLEETESGTNLVVLDANGEKVMNDKKTAYLSYKDVVTLEAEKHGLLKKNNLNPNGKPAPFTPKAPFNTPPSTVQRAGNPRR